MICVWKQGEKRIETNSSYINYKPGDAKWPFYPLDGGHSTFEGVMFSPSQTGHQQNCQESEISDNFRASSI